jgi:hypothetical protein
MQRAEVIIQISSLTMGIAAAAGLGDFDSAFAFLGT